MSDEVARESFYDALLDDDPVALYERAPCSYLSTTPDGTITKVNQTFLTWTGYRRDELVGRRSFLQLLTGGGRIYHETHYAPLLRMQGRVREIALDIVGADGRRRPALVNSVLERDADGQPRIIRTAIFDATERRQYEQELVRAKERAEASEAAARSLTRTLQQALIPPAPPSILHLDVAAAYRPAGTGDEIGGDFYDVFQLGPDDWAVAVGDVRGKGVEAAAVTVLARHTLRAASASHRRPSRVLQRLNEVLRGDDTDRFCTVALVRLRRQGSSWTATISCGGHPLPLLGRAGGEVGEVGRAGTLLGVFDEVSVSDTDVHLGPGDRLLLYTDGVTEAYGPEGWFGEERPADALRCTSRSAGELVDGLLDQVLTFQPSLPRDDIVMVAVRVPPTAVE